jgi:hypothetical protein
MDVKDRVKETSTTTGTGNFTLAGAATGYETFTANFPDGDRFYYCIQGQTGAEFEVGKGLLTGGALVREVVLASSNSDALVNFSAGTKDVFVTSAAISHKEYFQQQFAAWRPPISW